ncbi:carboxylesterase/lipase family protein [Streptomyces mirabilis]|uniref:carboxylesterase/lipase family protein n=1 Tax=Streptomyces mirabilis TaxID=68239 RepID=UPI003674A7B9
MDGTRIGLPQGELRGVLTSGVRCFLGVPYAAPPTGDLRFRAPRPPVPWQGVRDVVTYAPAAYQFDLSNREHVTGLVRRRDPGVEGVLPFPPAFMSDIMLDNSSEDCLYLDIYVPDRPDERPLPVFVYYHGGANVTNSASGKYDYQRGEALARAEGVIVVQPQYRLGALGWVHFGLVEPELGEAVNLGLQDQIAALSWVSENIAAFGGDPGNVTIAGESAGGTAVSHLITDPQTRRLARRAIVQSLSPFNNWCTQQEPEARAVAQTYQAVLGRGAVGEVDRDEFLALQNVMLRLFQPDDVLAWRPHGGVVDGDLVTGLPALRLTEETFGQEQFEVVIGFAKDEWQFFRGHTPTLQETDRDTAVRVLSQALGTEGARRAYNGYAELYPDHRSAHLLSDIMSFLFFKFSSLEIARSLAAQGVDVYVFQFSYDHPGLGGYLRAPHTGTLPFVFRSTSPGQRRAVRSLEGADIGEVDKVAAEFGALYGDFIRTGNPGEAWRRYDADDEAVLWFGVPVQTRVGLLRAERETFAAAGITSVRDLETRLLDRVRERLPAALDRLRNT